MLESIKNALGIELSEQVEKAMATANIELAIMNNGSVVFADKLDSLKVEYKTLTDKYQTDISESNSKLESAIANAADYDTLKGTLETMQAENTTIAENHKTELLNVRMDKDLDLLLISKNIDPAYLPLVKPQLNRDSLSYEGEKLIGGTDLVEAFIGKFPKMFGEVKKVGVTIDNGLNPTPGKRQQLIEQYNAAELKRDTNAMAAIDSQIRAIKE